MSKSFFSATALNSIISYNLRFAESISDSSDFLRVSSCSPTINICRIDSSLK